MLGMSIKRLANSVDGSNSGRDDIWNTTEFGSNWVDENQKRLVLPKNFLPIPPSAKLLSLKQASGQLRYQLSRKTPIVFQRTSVAHLHMPLAESSVTDYYHDALQKAGWKIERETRTAADTQIEASSSNLRGLVRVVHESAGSDLDLTIICEQ